MTARTGSGQVWVQDCVRKKQFSVGSIDTSHNTADLGTKFHSGERLQERVRMMPIVIGEFEPTKLPKKLVGTLFLASQVTRVQGNDESIAVTHGEEKYEEVILVLFGLVSGVLMMVLVRFVASYVFGGRNAESPVKGVEVGTQVDLLAYDEKLVEELVNDLNSRLLQPEQPKLVMLAGLFECLSGVRARKTVIVKEVIQMELVKMRVHWVQYAQIE